MCITAKSLGRFNTEKKQNEDTEENPGPWEEAEAEEAGRDSKEPVEEVCPALLSWSPGITVATSDCHLF